MNLTLVAVSLNDQPLSQPITAVFDSRGGTIGRADHNTMALPDPQRHISRLQAEIVVHGAAYIIRNVGASNPIVVNGRSLAHGDTAALSQNEQVRMGGYLLKAQLGPASASDASAYAHRPQAWAQDAAPALAEGTAAGRVVSASGPASGAAASPVPDSFAGLFDGANSASAGDPFGGLLSPVPVPASRRAADAGAPASKGGHGSTTDPFAGLFPPPAGVDPASQAVAAPAAAASLLPDDFDVFAEPGSGCNTPSRWTQGEAGSEAAFDTADAERGASADQAFSALQRADPLADIVHGAAGSASIDELFRLDASPGADPLAHFLERSAPGPRLAPTATMHGLSTDPLALFAAAAAPGPAPASSASGALQRTVPLPMAQADNLPAVNSAFAPPRVAPAALAPAPSPAPSPAPAPAAAAWPPATDANRPAPRAAAASPSGPAPASASAAAALPGAAAADAAPTETASPIPKDLWAAFCSGAGVEGIKPGAAPEQQMHELGRILRNAVDGTLQLMAVRASTKHELRAGVTIIQQRNNNPLKFSPDAVAALTQLLNPPLRGFLDGPAAMDDAMRDLVGHSIGTVAGLRAAVEGMLDRFAPRALESKLSSHSVFDNVLPAARKARLWDLYVQHHQAIHEEAQEDFHTLFGKAFLAAYEQQIERLKHSQANR